MLQHRFFGNFDLQTFLLMNVLIIILLYYGILIWVITWLLVLWWYIPNC